MENSGNFTANAGAFVFSIVKVVPDMTDERDNLKHGPFLCLAFEEFSKRELFKPKSGGRLPASQI